MEATVVSILPITLTGEQKPGIVPQIPIIPAAKKDDFTVVHIPDSSMSRYLIGGESAMLPVPGEQVAGAIANDYIKSCFAIEHDAFPGIKALPGKLSKEQVLESFGWDEENGLGGLKKVQEKWFVNLIRLADDSWTNPNNPGKHKSISDIQRAAARYLGLNRDWLSSIPVDQIQCPACRQFIPGDATICYNCKTVIVKNKVE